MGETTKYPHPFQASKCYKGNWNTLQNFRNMDYERTEKGPFTYRISVEIDLKKGIPDHI